MRKITLLIIVQTLFTCGFSQIADTLYLPVKNDSLAVPFTEKRGNITVSENTLEAVFYVCESMSEELCAFEGLVTEYDRADSIQLLTELQLREIISLKDTQIIAYRAHTADLNRLVDKTVVASNIVLQDNLKLRIQKRWFLLGGIGIGFAGGLFLSTLGN